MFAFLLRRVVSGVVLIVVISALTFALLSATGSDPARNVVGQNATAAQVDAKAKELKLDQPLATRYLDWLKGAVHGDLGVSWFTNQPVKDSLKDRLPVTLSIVLVGLLVSAIVSVVLGVAAAVRRGWLDGVVQGVAIAGFAVPSFLVAMLLALFVAVKWGLLPATGYTPFSQSPSGWLQTITLPALALAVGAVAATAQQVRGSMIDVLRADYIRTLRSRGLNERSLLYKHALRNAAPPALTVLSLQFIGLIGGALFVERIFGMQGIGTQILTSSDQNDVPTVMGVVVTMVVLVVLVNLVMDVVYGWLNPKVRA
jgi:peptide/nickel transport system permease protein